MKKLTALKSLPPIPVISTKTWESPGINVKPPLCQFCKFSFKGRGFVPDYVGSDPKLALMFPFPLKDEVIEREALKSNAGWYYLKNFVEPFGYGKQNLIISHVLRCGVPWSGRKKDYDYPIGAVRLNAENSCRVYDNQHSERGELALGGLQDFLPDLYLITFDPKDIRKVPAYFRQLKRDMEKAWKFVAQGRRPVVLFGNEPAELVAEYIRGKGSAKAWRGSFADMDGWAFNRTNLEGGFLEAGR